MDQTHIPARSETGKIAQYTVHTVLLPLLIVGDIAAFIIFAAIGRSSHGLASGLQAFVEVITTALPFILGWLLTSPFLGSYRSTTITTPLRMMKLTALAWLVACPVGLLLRALFLQRGIPVSFALVTFISNLLLLVSWRTLLAWFISRYRR